jgi:hypothetical protein
MCHFTKVLWKWKTWYETFLAFNDKDYSKFNISCTFQSTNFQIAFIRSRSSTAFQQYQEHAQNFPIIFSFHLNELSVKKCSIFNNWISIVVGWKIVKPNQCTPTHWELSNDTKSMARGAVVWEISKWQTKQNITNYLPS